MPGRLQLVLPPGQEADLDPAIAGGVHLASMLCAQLTVSVGQTSATAPAHWLAHEYAVAHVAEHNARIAAEAERLKTRALAAAADANVGARALELVNGVIGAERSVVLAARTHDFTILGLGDQSSDGRRIAEEVLFNSGRPLLLLPLSRPFALDLDTVAIAWDHSEPASRLVGAAMPLLSRAKRVFVFSVLGVKKLPQAGAAGELAGYLESHGLKVERESVESDDRARGRFIMEKAIARGAGLLMMGAYATLPAQEYLMGGVTVSVLNEPLLPILMAN